jgi:hypothetical protein
MIALLFAAVVIMADTNKFAVCPLLPSTSDTAAKTIYGKVSDPFTGLTMPQGFTGVIVEAVRTKMTVPANLPIAAFDLHGWPTVVMTAAFSLMPSGAVENVTMMSSSSSMTVDSLLEGAIWAAARDSSYPPLPPRATHGIRLAFEVSPDSTAGAVPLFTVRVPHWWDYAPPQMQKNPLRGELRKPTAVRGELDTLEVNFVVDEKGTPLLGTAHVTRSPGTDFARSYLDWLKTGHFVPGHINKCAVRSLVRLKGTTHIVDEGLPF